MSTKNIYLSKDDHTVLNHLLRGLSAKIDTVFRLRAELSRAIVLDADEVPDEAIGLGSDVEIEDLDSGEREAYTLTLPAQSDFEQGRLSILTPIGAGLLGYEEGDEIEWPTPGGLRRIRVLRVRRTCGALPTCEGLR
ncbi:GreA/GreB family elongation factor [Coraliomargarita algicola]|uniref:GreA/GreB family elongation factor n=1 Tax=Coraliomargarita algicola TaxID=3092156 RepID=A0ABZ0RGN2_9BACT|nr:GreA/GreB family elongation factor [Coraliomargarita sp. J2-16]WPJ94683.1 GreA/GreB family elongation factor [Coraliomargarita sp. J2-16]